MDLVLTDPPYHDDVQYSELSLPFRAWAQLASGPLFGEAVVNAAIGQLTDDGAYEGLLLRHLYRGTPCPEAKRPPDLQLREPKP